MSASAASMYVPADSAFLAKARAIRDICDKYDVPLAAAAIQFRWRTRARARC